MAGIGALCRYWEGGFVSGGLKCFPGGSVCLDVCLEVVGAGAVLCLLPPVAGLAR